MKPKDINTIVYHHPCPDGLASALAFYVYLERNNKDVSKYNFIKGNYGNKVLPICDKNTNLLICDFSYDYDTTIELLNMCNDVLILDHHKSAEKVLHQIPDKNKVFNMNKSGAVITWEYFFPGEEIPLLIQYIQDRDIWTNKMMCIEEFVAWFHKLPLEIPVYKQYLDNDEFKNGLMRYGFSTRIADSALEENILNNSYTKFCTIFDKHYIIAFCNSPIMKSDIGNKMLSKHKFCDFSITYDFNIDKTVSSLRSDNTKVDVSEVALLLGGGGHRNAAAFVNNFDFVKKDEPISVYMHSIADDCGPINIAVVKCSNLKKVHSYMEQIKYDNISVIQSICNILYGTLYHNIITVTYNDDEHYMTDYNTSLYVAKRIKYLTSKEGICLNTCSTNIVKTLNYDYTYYIDRCHPNFHFCGNKIIAFINFPVLQQEIVQSIMEKYKFVDQVYVFMNKSDLDNTILVPHIDKVPIVHKKLVLNKTYNVAHIETDCKEFAEYLLKKEQGALQNIIILHNYFREDKKYDDVDLIINSNNDYFFNSF